MAARYSHRRFRALVAELLEPRRLLAAVTVTGTGDTIAVDGVVTLREAIQSANTNADANADVTAQRSGTYLGSGDPSETPTWC